MSEPPDLGGMAERLRRLLLLVEPDDGSLSPLLGARPDVVAVVAAAAEAARAARELMGLASEGSGYNGAASVEDQRTTLLPLNRKERFYTGTVLPIVLAHDGFAHLHRFVELCGIQDVATPPRRDGTAPCQLISEYNFTESLVGADDPRWEVRPRPGDTPDVVLIAADWLIAVEAKMFDRPTTAQLARQLDRQRPFLDEWADVLSIPAQRVRHVALLPAQLAAELGPLPTAVVTWQTITDAYRVVGPAYWVGVLDVACGRWSSQVAKPRVFGRNAEAYLTGQAIVDFWRADALNYGFMGRSGGTAPGGRLAMDIASGAWRTQRYEVRAEPLLGNANWFPIDGFVASVDPPGPPTASR